MAIMLDGCSQSMIGCIPTQVAQAQVCFLFVAFAWETFCRECLPLQQTNQPPSIRMANATHILMKRKGVG